MALELGFVINKTWTIIPGVLIPSRTGAKTSTTIGVKWNWGKQGRPDTATDNRTLPTGTRCRSGAFRRATADQSINIDAGSSISSFTLTR